MAFSGGIETIDLSPYVSAGTAAAGPSLSGFGGSESYQDTSYNYGPQQSQGFQNLTAAATPSWSTSQTFGDALSGLQAAGYSNIMEALAAYNAAKQQEYFFTPATGAGIAALSPTTANDLMIRAMTTGVPTQEFNKYGGYDVVKNLYDKAGGSYSLESISPQKITDLAKTIAGQGFGNYAALIEAGIPDLRVNWTPQQLSFGQQLFQSNPTTEQLFNVSSRLGFSPDQMANLLYQSSGADFKNTLEKIEDYLIRERKSLPGGYRYDLSQFPKTGIESLLKDSGQKFETYAGLEPGQAGIDKLTGYDPTKITNLPSLYQAVLGRAPDTGGLEFYKAIAESGISPEEYREFLKAAQPELQVQKAYYDVLGRKYDPTGLSYYTELVKSGQLPLTDLAKTLASGATGVDIVPAQQYKIIGDQKFLNDFEKVRPNIEKTYGLPANSLKTDINASTLANKNLEEIQNVIRDSGANRFQEAIGTSNLVQELYGLTDEQKKELVGNLLKGKESNTAISNYYNSLVKEDVKKDITNGLIVDAAKKAPNSPYFKANPQDLLYAKPAGELKRGEETSYTYGAEPKYGFALISKIGGDKALDEDGDVVLSGFQDLRDNTSLQYIGADPHSAWAGAFARGTGALGVTASKGEIADFARIEKELNRLGGVQRQVDPDTGSAMDVVYVERKDPESDRTYRVPVTAEQFFRDQLADKYPAVSEEDPFSQARFTRDFDYTSAYDYYKQTKNALDKIATGFYKDPAKVPQYGSIKEAYNDLNDKYKDLYLWRGRTDTLDPEALKKLGIEDPTANDSHIQAYLEPKGDWLVPKTKKELVDGKIVEKPMIESFKFSDPNTTSGFFGDLFNFAMEIMATPIGAAVMGGLTMPGGPLASATSSLAGQIGSSGLASFLPPGITSDMVARALISSGIGALPAAAGGDFDRFGRAFLTNLAGSGVQMGAGALGVNPFVSKLLGAGAAAGLSDRDIGDALTRVATSEGISTLLNNVPTGDFDKKLIAAFAPAILSGKLTPSDLMRITQAVNPPKK